MALYAARFSEPAAVCSFGVSTDFGGDDVIINNGTVADGGSHVIESNGAVMGDWVVYNAGNDLIINSPTGIVEGNVYGEISWVDGGDDTIINEGLVHLDIRGDQLESNPGKDDITNSGAVLGDIYGDYVYSGVLPGTTGDGNDDTITNSGRVDGGIFAEGGNDIVVLQNGANGGADQTLPIDGGLGTDALHFDFTLANLAQLETLSAELAGKNPTGDSIIINGETYVWTNFESLVDDLTTDLNIRITENELHNAMQDEIASNPQIVDLEFVLPDFTPGVIQMTVRTTGGVVATANVTVSSGDGVAIIAIQPPLVGGEAAPADVSEAMYRELPQLITAGLDRWLSFRLGTSDFDLKTIAVDDQFIAAEMEL